MKKVFSLLLVLLMTFSMVACDSENKTADNKSSQAVTSDAPIIFQEQVLVDNAQCKIQITGVEPEGEFGYTLNATLENKSAEKTYVFALTGSSVNGVIANSIFGMELAPGEKANEGIYIGDEELQEALGDFTDICLSFKVTDPEDWAAEPVAECTEHIYPLGKDKAKNYVRTPSDSDVVVADNDNVTIIITGYAQDDYYGYYTKLYLVNKTDATATFSADQVSINGMMADPYFSTDLEAGEAVFTNIVWDVSFLEDNEMSKVEEISMVLFAYNADNWEGEYLANESVVLNP